MAHSEGVGMEDLGKLLFSFDIDNSLPIKEYVQIGRSICYRHAKRDVAIAMMAAFIIFFVTMAFLVLAITFAVIVGSLVIIYMELSSKSLAAKIKRKQPFHYEFYEEGLVETVSERSVAILYNRFKQVKITKNVIVLFGKKNEHVTVAVPRSLIDEDAEQKLFKLQKLLG